MATEPLYEDELPPDETPALALPAIRRRPTVWPVFVTCAILAAAYIGGQIALVMAWVVWQIAMGGNLQEVANGLMDAIGTPEGLTILLASSQITIVVAALIGAWFLAGPIGANLGLRKPAVPVWSYPIVIIGVIVPGIVGTALATVVAQIIPTSDPLEKIGDQLTWISGPIFAVLLGIVPGFYEELFFRGYMQRRLLQAWAPWSAIAVSSGLFGLLHLAPHQVVFAFVIGLWLGVIGWRTGSIWLCVLAHAMWNSGGVMLTITLKKLGLEDDPPLIPTVIAGVIALVCFAASIWILWRHAPPSTVEPVAQETPITVLPYEPESGPLGGDAISAD